MTDIDSYLLKCTLESIEEGVPAKDIEKKCEYQMGFKHLDSNKKVTINLNKEKNNVRSR